PRLRRRLVDHGRHPRRVGRGRDAITASASASKSASESESARPPPPSYTPLMLGRMMDYPLTLTHLLDRARSLFADQEIVSRRWHRPLARATYSDMLVRCEKLAAALKRLGVKNGDRVATLCWNHQQHLEAYLAVPAMGAVVHTLNLRLHPNELGYIAKH